MERLLPLGASALRAAARARGIASSAPLAAPLCASTPLLQQKKGGKAGPAAGPVFEEKFDLTKQIPVNLLKGALGGWEAGRNTRRGGTHATCPVQLCRHVAMYCRSSIWGDGATTILSGTFTAWLLLLTRRRDSRYPAQRVDLRPVYIYVDSLRIFRT